jgi:SAM-dependent methyltransferase
VGVDLDEGVVAHAGRHYPRARFEKADLLALPFDDASFDAVVSFQVIEHVSAPREFLAECARVLRPGGRLILSTPNRLTFSRDGVCNPFHVYEFTARDLRGLVERSFAIERLCGTFHRARLRRIELLLRKPFTERLIEQPAPEWPRWLRRSVERTKPEDFLVADNDLDRCLDLIVVARR